MLLREGKRLVLNTLFRGELARLCRLTERIAAGTIEGRDLAGSRLSQALAEVLIAFPVYRTYVDGGVIRNADSRYIGRALAGARSSKPDLGAEIDFIAALFDAGRTDAAGDVGAEAGRAWRGLFQQLSSPLTAKGFEDTFLYVYNRLLSLNDVGGFPRRFGISPQDFHRFCTDRNGRWPNSLNATATHDTKRGEEELTRELKDVLGKAIDMLPERERQLIAFYYQEDLTLREISRILGLGEPRVCQLHAQAVLRLKGKINRHFR